MGFSPEQIDAHGDEGSAYWIGRHGLRRAAQEIDGRAEAAGFPDVLCAAMSLPPPWQPSTLLSWQADQIQLRSAVAALAMLDDTLAQAGHPVAVGLLAEAARHLAALLWAVRARSSLYSYADRASAGSDFRSALLGTAVKVEIGQDPVAAVLSLLGGGLLIAARQAGWGAIPPWLRTMGAGAEAPMKHFADVPIGAFSGQTHFVFLGGGTQYGAALEGALKLQEMAICYTQTFHPGEYRHGPISLADEQTAVVMLYSDKTHDDEVELVAELRKMGVWASGRLGAGIGRAGRNRTAAAHTR